MSLSTGILSVNEIEKIKKNIVLFKVATDELGYNFKLSLNGQAIDIDNRYSHANNIAIYLRALSKLPTAIEHIEQPFVSFTENNTKALNAINFDSDRMDLNEQLQYLRNELQGKLILAIPRLHIDNRKKDMNESDPYHFNYEMVYVSQEKPLADAYNTIPSVSSHIDRRRFETMLKNKEYILFRNYNAMMQSPEFVICEDTLYHFPDITTKSLTPNIKNISTFYCQDYKEVKRIKLPYEFKDKCQCTYKGLHFIPLGYTAELRDLLHEKGKPLDVPLEFEATAPVVAQSNEGSKKEAVKSMTDYIDEYDFIMDLKNQMIRSNLYYDDIDIESFHTAVKTNFLTIVGGMSGTGKTQLVMNYCKTLGLIKGNDLLIIPISPSYTEPSDILGYLNPQTGAYIESNTGLASFLLKASKESHKLHVVLFEEMNLSQVEHWFAPFISLLELDEEHRVLQLVSEKQYCMQEEYRKPIKIGNNVIFIGTVNLDETTKEFSNRLLDRANLVQLKKQSFFDAKNNAKDTVEVRHFDKISADNFRSWVRETKKPFEVMTAEEIKVLDGIHQALSKVDAQNGVSFRIVKAMAHFINNIPEDKDGGKLFNRNTAFDIQICQRILTKIKGHREMLQDLLGIYNPATGEIKGGSLRKVLESFENPDEVSDQNTVELMYKNFSLTVDVLEQKAKDLVVNGYTM